ncbi:MAG: hypothetical protein IJT54_08240 [Candidatus Methanomethylophilaceae archaeon]|nr:hypothetical protein [Candidatus Methanomethylophilaceae archaeon]
MKKKVLVLVKAEPAPSSKYGSSVCTAGITEEGEFIRLYPVPFQIFCDPAKRFNKYDWIEVECERSDSDYRKESYKIKPETIRTVGHIGTDYNWQERNSIILPHVSKNIAELKESNSSLGIIKPTEILDFYRDKKTNDAEIRNEFRQTFQLIFDEEGGMKKIPHIRPMDVHYSYIFKCDGDEKHDYICEDWELYQSSRSWLDRYGTEDNVWDKIYEKYYDTFTKENDLHFFVGTHYRFKTWMIIGLYYPPKTGRYRQTTLFSKTRQ